MSDYLNIFANYQHILKCKVLFESKMTINLITL